MHSLLWVKKTLRKKQFLSLMEKMDEKNMNH